MANDRRQAKRARSEQAKKARQRAAQRKRMAKMVSIVVVVVLIVGSVAFVTQLGGNDSNCPEADGSSSKRIDFSSAPDDCIDEGKKYAAEFDTSEGLIKVDLDTATTPKTVNNFVALSRYHYYDGTQIFRTDPTIDIIQGGSPHTNDASDPGPGYNLQDEGRNYKYVEGDLVMARTSQPNSASGQFFFGTGPKVSSLDAQGTYVKFGKTTEGLDTLKKIMALHSGGETSGKPSKPVTVNSVRITQS